jgi:hypothetical protein
MMARNGMRAGFPFLFLCPLTIPRSDHRLLECGDHENDLTTYHFLNDVDGSR